MRSAALVVSLSFLLATPVVVAEPQSAPSTPAAPAKSAFVPSVLCLPLPALTPPAKPASGEQANTEEIEAQELLDLDGDGVRDRIIRSLCDGREHCTYDIFIRRGNCGYYVGGLLSDPHLLKLLPGKHQGLRDLNAGGCYRGGCENYPHHFDGHYYVEPKDAQSPSARPLRFFPGVGIERVMLGLPMAELVRQGFVDAGPGVSRQASREANLAAD